MSAYGKINSGERPEVHCDTSTQAREQALFKLDNFLCFNRISARITGSNSIFFSLDDKDNLVEIKTLLRDAENTGAISFSLQSCEGCDSYEVNFLHCIDDTPDFIPDFLRSHFETFRRSIQSEVAGIDL